MTHLHKKMKKGRPYYYVRETARVGGRSKVVNQVYLGSAVSPPEDEAMEHMRTLGSCLIWHSDKRKSVRLVKDPTPAQANILKIFGYEIAGGVSQKLAS